MTQIKFKQGNLTFSVEENFDSTYTIDIYNKDFSGTEELLVSLRTDEVSVGDLADGLKFARDYHFIQENEPTK